MEHKSGCLICGKEIEYENDFENVECYYCKATYHTNVKCTNGHFVCDTCHSSSANDLIERFCTNSKMEDPIEMALILMRNPKLKMHGPEHHFLVPAVLISSYYNVKKDIEEKGKKIKLARSRAEKILGGFCGSHGNCGAGVGTGIFISLITQATPISEHEWKLSNLMTSKSLLSIANAGGPRCCKRDTFLSLIAARNFLKENFGVILNEHTDINCEFNSLNKECIKANCPFYPQRSDG